MDFSKLYLTFFIVILLFFVGFSRGDCFLELKGDIASLSGNIEEFLSHPLTTFSAIVFAFDETLSRVYPKSSFLSFLDKLDFPHFLGLAILASAIVFPIDSYTSFTILESFTFTTIVVGLTKFLTGRMRPYVENNPYAFKPLNFSKDYQSFPSGHSALSWAIFTPLSLRFGDFWFAVPMVISAQRLWSNNHWTSDVLFGASIGYNIGKIMFSNKEE